ncbi:MAG: P1 family peptidase, partial [Gemmatimonadaceae bacterium]|nr:P1 family peptidase [Gemmatimonadaceae bacterium]
MTEARSGPFRVWHVLAALGALSTVVAPRAAACQDSAAAIPKVYKEGPVLRFDFPELRVGTAEYDEGPTGTTVFYFPKGVKGAVDVRGGAPGTVNATTLMNGYESKMIQAVVFSGGSWYGLSAATGVANGIKEINAEEGKVDVIAGVVGAIIYDVGGRRYSRVTPDDRLGKAALRSAATGSFPLGARGAGRSAMQGVYYLRGKGADKFADWPHSGQGGAFRTIGPTRIGVFTVVNALGAVVDRNGRVVRCKRNSSGTGCPMIADQLKAFAPISSSVETRTGGPTGNTTLTLVVTNQKLPFWALQRLAVQVHGSMSRAIQPFATEEDGDVLYAVTTDEIENASLSHMDLSVIASELAWDAILSSVPVIPAPPAPLGTQPTADVLRRYSGTYELYGGNRLTVSVEAGFLHAELQGIGAGVVSVSIAVLHAVRGLAFVPEVAALWRGSQPPPPRHAVFSLVALATGMAYLVGTWRARSSGDSEAVTEKNAVTPD